MTRVLFNPLLLLIAAILFALAGCQQASEATAPDAAPAMTEQMPDEFSRLEKCTDPRPEICTQNYAPVCGVHEDGSRQTYSNSCTACSNPAVVGALPEPCPE